MFYHVDEWGRFRLTISGDFKWPDEGKFIEVEWSAQFGIRLLGRWFIVSRDKLVGEKPNTDFMVKTVDEIKKQTEQIAVSNNWGVC